ncbi:exonuclease domain-containing protein [Pelagibius sp.]|uniref:exonuclease domain-containing protein n=1 Tax=Pelagibius sp. TaxID=1931238 RepID=UPI003BAE8691
MIIRVIDFETTGLPPDASVCEAAAVDLVGDPPEVGPCSQTLVQPTTEMTLEALATHHITAEQARTGMTWDDARAALEDGHPDVFVAHNADFEKAFFDPEGAIWVDTYKVALRLWPDAPRHTNQVLRYALGLNLDERAMPPHRALPDAWVTAHILLEALRIATLQDMVRWTQEPSYLTKLTFGKHRGQKYSDVPRDYLQWLSRQDMDPGVIAAAKRELAN